MCYVAASQQLSPTEIYGEWVKPNIAGEVLQIDL